MPVSAKPNIGQMIKAAASLGNKQDGRLTFIKGKTAKMRTDAVVSAANILAREVEETFPMFVEIAILEHLQRRTDVVSNIDDRFTEEVQLKRVVGRERILVRDFRLLTTSAWLKNAVASLNRQGWACSLEEGDIGYMEGAKHVTRHARCLCIPDPFKPVSPKPKLPPRQKSKVFA